MKKNKLNQGVSTGAIVGIVAAVVLAGAGGYYLLKGNTTAPPAPATSQTTATSPVTPNMSTGNKFSSLTCDQIFPTGPVNQAFPNMKFKLVKDAASNDRHLICAYDAGTVSGGTLILFEAMVTIYPLDPQVYSDSITGYNMLMKTSATSVTNFTCSASTVGIKSSLCTATLTSGPDKSITEMIFAPTNKNYIALVNLTLPTATSQGPQIVTQMATQVNAKL